MNESVSTAAYRLYLCPIADGAGARREREKAATEALTAEAFGSGAAIAHTPDGAPLLSGHPDIKISLSHSRTTCLLAVGLDPYINIGVDIESPRRKLLDVAPRFLTAAEQRLADNVPDETEKIGILLKIWTSKEAVYKAALTPGLGLTEILTDMDFTSAEARGMRFSLAFHALPDGQLIAVALKC